MRNILVGAMLSAFSTQVGAATVAESNYRIFAGCPVYRDTDAGRKSGCWLVQSPVDGVRYDVTMAPVKPDYSHPVLIEGRVSATQDNACGGVVLEPASVSVLEGSCPRFMLPPEGYPGRRFTLPETNVPALGGKPPTVDGPFTAQTFRIFFSFNSSFIEYQSADYYFDKAATWMRAAKPRRIVVTGYRARQPIANGAGEFVSEDVGIARARADVIARALVMLGFDKKAIAIKVNQAGGPVEDPAVSGLPEASCRRVEIRAEF